MNQKTLMSVLVLVLFVMSGVVKARTTPVFKTAFTYLSGHLSDSPEELTIKKGNVFSFTLAGFEVLDNHFDLVYGMGSFVNGEVNGIGGVKAGVKSEMTGITDDLISRGISDISINTINSVKGTIIESSINISSRVNRTRLDEFICNINDIIRYKVNQTNRYKDIQIDSLHKISGQFIGINIENISCWTSKSNFGAILNLKGNFSNYYNPFLNRNRIYRKATVTNPSDEELSNITTIKANSNNLQNRSLKQKKRIIILAKRQPTIRENKSIGTYVYYNTLTTPIRI